MYLICDFDGTLIRNDFFEEKFYKCLIEQPWLIIKHGLKQNGLLNLKHHLLDEFSPEYDTGFLFNHGVIQWINNNRGDYKKVLLISASPDPFVRRIVEPLNIFDSIHGSINSNLRKYQKLQFIKESGLLPFSYIGDSEDDSPVFDASLQAYKIVSDGIRKLK